MSKTFTDVNVFMRAAGQDIPPFNANESKQSELYKKLAIAQRSGNGHLGNQLRMALETYQNRYQAVLNETYKKSGGPDFSDKIDIS